MSKERFEVFGKIIKDNEEVPNLLDNYLATVRLNELNDRIKELEQDLEFTTKTANELIEIKHKLEHQLDQQKAMWNELKEWLEKKKSWNERQLKEAPINTEFYIRVSVQGITINKILDKMQELEVEDDNC